MLYDVGRLRAGYVPYRDTFNHHFVGYIVPFYWLAAIVSLSPVTLKVIALACHFATAVVYFSSFERSAAEIWHGSERS